MLSVYTNAQLTQQKATKWHVHYVYLRHPWKTFTHVCNNIYNGTTIVRHPQSIY